MLAKKPEPVATQNVCRIDFTIAECHQSLRRDLQVGDRIELRRNGLQAKAAIEIRADPRVVSIARQLTDMVDVGDERVQRDFLPAAAVLPQPANLEKGIQR